MALILGISGTPRRGGNSEILLKQILSAAAESGHDAEAVFLRAYDFSSCRGCERCRRSQACDGLQDGMQLIYPLVRKAKGLVLISPTHNYNVSALMKAFIDRLYCFYDFGDERPGPWSSRLAGQGRRALIAAVAEQPGRDGLGVVLPAMRLPLEALGYEVMGELIAPGVFAAGQVRNQPESMARARSLGEGLGRALA